MDVEVFFDIKTSLRQAGVSPLGDGWFTGGSIEIECPNCTLNEMFSLVGVDEAGRGILDCGLCHHLFRIEVEYPEPPTPLDPAPSTSRVGAKKRRKKG